jgi:hypothetical protein
MNPERERRFDELCDALDENTKSKAIDRAAELAIALLGSGEYDQGQIDELLETADEQGALTADQIATILDTDTIPIEFESSWSIDE